MKFLGKLATAVLSLSFCFSAFGCVDPTFPDSSGNNGESSNNQEQQSTVGTSLTNAIIGQLKDANTLVITLSAIDEETFVSKLDETESYTAKEVFENQVTFAKTESGYNLKAVKTEKSYEDGREIFGTEEDAKPKTSYVIDGIAYDYEENLQAWTYNPYEKQKTVDFSAISNMLTTDETAQLKALFAEALGTVYEIDSKSISLGVDWKDQANALIDYAAALDIDTKTVESLLNDALALIDEELTVTSILAEIASIDDKTVDDALTAIDGFLTEQADTTLQGLKDELLADERVIALLKTEGGMTDEDVQAAKDLQLDEALAEYKDVLLDEIVYNFVAPYVFGEFDPETQTYAAFLEQLETAPEEIVSLGVDSFISYLTNALVPQTLTTTLAELIGDEDQIEDIKFTLDMFNTVNVNEMKATVDVAFDNYFAIEDLAAYAGFETVSDTDEYTMTTKMSVHFTVDSISSQTTEIALPEGETPVFAFWRNDISLEHNSGLTLYYPDFSNGIPEKFEGYFYPDPTSSVCVNFEYTRPTEPTNTWEITIISIDGIEGEELSDLLGGDLTYTLTFDFDGTGDYITDFAIPLQ